MKSPLIETIANDLIPYFKLQILQSAMSTRGKEQGFDVKFKNGDFGKVFQKKMESYDPNTRRIILRRYAEKLYEPDISSVLLKTKIRLRSSTPVLKVATAPKGPLTNTLTKRLAHLQSEIKAIMENVGQADQAPSTGVNKRLDITLTKVQCIDETNPEGGSDEIDMAFIKTLSDGVTAKDGPFHVGEFKRDRTTRYPRRSLMKAALNDDYSKVKFFTITALMAEIDGGGFASFVNDAYEAVRNEINAAIVSACASAGNAAGGWIGAQIGGTAGSIAGPIGTLIGIIIGLVVVALIAWIIESFKDDPFDPVTFSIGLPSTDCDFAGSLSKEIWEDHRIKGGLYRSHYKIELKR